MGSPETLSHEAVEHEERPRTVQLAVLISNKGTGSNLQAVIDARERKEINCDVALVVSDRPGAMGLERAEKHNIPWMVRELKKRKEQSARDAYGKELADLLNNKDIKVVVLAGFMTILSRSYFETFQGITINVHPGLIPDDKDEPYRFPDETDAPWNQGLMTEKAVENFLGLHYAGSTIHVATEEADFGPVLERVVIPTQPNDTVDTLYSRLKLEEHRGLIRILQNPAEIFEKAGKTLRHT